MSWRVCKTTMFVDRSKMDMNSSCGVDGRMKNLIVNSSLCVLPVYRSRCNTLRIQVTLWQISTRETVIANQRPYFGVL